MDLGKLSREGYIKPVGKDARIVENALKAAEKDLTSAKRTVAMGDLDWALAMAYSSMLQAGIALMNSMGYRPAAEGSHLAVVKFAAEALPKESGELMNRFNKLRIRRHTVIYEERGTVTREEVEGAVARAQEFIKVVRGMLAR